jgi:hypothetical protein
VLNSRGILALASDEGINIELPKAESLRNGLDKKGVFLTNCDIALSFAMTPKIIKALGAEY